VPAPRERGDAPVLLRGPARTRQPVASRNRLKEACLQRCQLDWQSAGDGREIVAVAEVARPRDGRAAPPAGPVSGSIGGRHGTSVLGHPVVRRPRDVERNQASPRHQAVAGRQETGGGERFARVSLTRRQPGLKRRCRRRRERSIWAPDPIACTTDAPRSSERGRDPVRDVKASRPLSTLQTAAGFV